MIGRKSDEQRLRELALDFDAKQGRPLEESRAVVDAAPTIVHGNVTRTLRRDPGLPSFWSESPGLLHALEKPVAPPVEPSTPKDVALKFADDMFGKEDEAAETALQVTCAFIEERQLAGEFSEFTKSELKSYEEHRIGMYEADLDPDEPSVEHLRERVARLESWLANAKKDLADYEAYLTKESQMNQPVTNRCPCGGLGILVEHEAPHTTAEICRNAIYTAYVGRRSMSVIDQLRCVDRELSRPNPDIGTARAELKRAFMLLGAK